MRTGQVLAAAALLALVTSCKPQGAEWMVPAPPASEVGDLLTLRGTVRHSGLEGGFFYIEADGSKYSPTNLPAALQKDGIAVEAEVRRRDDLMGVNQVGPIVDIVRIRAR